MCAHVYITSYTHEKYLTFTIEEDTAKAEVDKRDGNFIASENIC